MQQYLDKFAKLPGSTKAIILVVLVAVVGFGYFWFDHREVKARIEAQESQIAKLRDERDKNAKIAEHLDEYKAEVARLQEELERAKALLPNDREIDDLLKSVANLGKKVGLQFLLFRPLPDVRRDFYAEVPVEISIQGGYHEIALFFAKVGQLKRIVNIQNVAMTSPIEKNGKMQMTVTGQAVTFRFLEQAAAKAAPAKGRKGK